MPSSDALKGMAREEKLAFILDAAMKCLAQYGSSAITMDWIAKEAGVSKGTLSYYFKSKEDIIIQLASHIANKFYSEIRQTIKEYDNPKECLIQAIEQFWSKYMENPEILVSYYDLWGQGFFSKLLKQEVISIYHDFRSIFLDELSKIYDLDNRYIYDAILIAGVLDGVAMQFLLEPDLVENWDTVKQRLIAVVKKILD